MKTIWDAIKESRLVAWLALTLVLIVTIFAGQYDEIRILEYWTLLLVSFASATYVMLHFGEEKVNP